MIYKKGLVVLASMAILCGFEGLSHSEDFCVGTSQELQDALTTAAGNDESDLIKIAQGTYIGNFQFFSSNGDAVSVLGGYSTDCSTRTVNPVNTVLDGNNDGLVLQVTNTAGGNIDIKGLKIQHGEVASSGAGILARSFGSDIGGNITFTNNWVTENTDISSNSGGGIYIWSEGNTTGGNITLTSNKVTQNKGGIGGGIYARSYSYSGQGGNVSLIKNIIINNSATHMSGGVDAQSYATEGFSGDITFIGNLIAGNKATNHAGGVFVDSFSNNGTAGDTFFVNNTIVENRTNGIGGGLLLNRRADNYFYNNLFWGNFPSQDVLQGAAGTVNGFNNNGMQFNNWTNSADNLDVDPLFVANGSWDDNDTPEDASDDVWLEGDYHLQTDSPCIDSGSSDAPDIPVDDFEMDPRVADGDFDGTATVDIGADEFYTLCPMDVDGDGDVDGSDLATCTTNPGVTALNDVASDFGGQGCRIPFYSPRLYNLRLSQTILPVPSEGERYKIVMSFEYEDHDADIQELFLTRINPGGTTVLRTKAFTPTGTGGIFMEQLTIDSTYTAGTYTIRAEIVDARGIKSEIRTVTFSLDEATAPPLAISGMSPLTGKPGDTITIQGVGFVDDPPSGNHVYFEGTRAEVVAAAPDALEVVVPEGAQSGPVVVETAAGHVTSADPFTVVKTITISPVITRMATGEVMVFTYTVSGGMPSGLLWLAYADEPCTGIECGTISVTDTHCTYTAPDAVPPSNPVYIRCSSADDNLVYGEIAIEIVAPPSPPGEAVISPTEGGEVTDANHTVQISVPANALVLEETIAIEELDPESIPLPSTDSVNMAAARFSPPGLNFSGTTTAEVIFTLTSWLEPGTVLDLLFYDDILGFFQNVGTVVVAENGLSATGQLEQFEEAGYDPGSMNPEDGMEYGSPTYVVNRPLGLTTSRAQVLQNFTDKLRDFSSLWIIRKPIDLVFYEGQSIPVIIKPLIGQGIGPGPLHPMIPVTAATQNETIPIGAKQVKPDGWQLGTVLHIPVIPDCNEGETRYATVSIGGAGTDEEITVGFDIQCLCELNFDGNTPPGVVPDGVDTAYWESQRTVYLDHLGQTYRFSEINLGAGGVLKPAYTSPANGVVIDPLLVEVTGDVYIAGEVELRGFPGGYGKNGSDFSYSGEGGAAYHINAGVGGHGGPVESTVTFNFPIPFFCSNPPCELTGLFPFGLTGQNALGAAGIAGTAGAGGTVWESGCWFSFVLDSLMLVGDLATGNWVGAVQDACNIADEAIKINNNDDNYTASAGEGGTGGGPNGPKDLVFFYPPAAGGGGGGSGKKDADTGCSSENGAGGGGGGGGACNLKLVAGGSVMVEPGGIINGWGGSGGRGGNGQGNGDGQAAPGGGGGGGGGAAIHIVAVKGLINNGEIKAPGGMGGVSGEIEGDFGDGVQKMLVLKSFGGIGKNGILRVDGSFSGNSPVGMSFYRGPVFGDANRFAISADATLPVHQFLGDEGRIDLGDGSYTGNEFIQDYPLSDGFNTLAISIDSPYTPEVNEMELHPWQKLYVLYFAGMPDSDGDGLADGMEDYIGTRSDLPDTDGDGLVDGQEVNLYGTDPLLTDTDSDGLFDGNEITVGTLPLIPDSDSDGLLDGDEVNTHGTDPLDGDSDNDGLADGDEVHTHSTDPLDADSDDDSLSDGDEVNTYSTSPTNPDTDDDGLTDDAEINTYQTNPLNRDTDGDEYDDLVEINAGTDPNDPEDYPSGDDDKDGLPDQWEFDQFGNLGQDAGDDGDEDFLTNLAEYNAGTNPTLPDTDTDGFWDNVEIDRASDPLDEDSTPEVCDGIDNDGDTQIDEGVCQQYIDQKGKDFIVAFLPSEQIDPDPTVSLIITGELPTDVTISYPVISPTWSQTVAVSRYQSATVTVPFTASTAWTHNVPMNNALRVTSGEEITVVMKNSKAGVRDQALALPVDALGTSYTVANRRPGNTNGSQVIVVATQDNTSVVIGSSTTAITLDRGEGYLEYGSGTLAGTIISADKPVAVVNGNRCAKVPWYASYCEHLFEMAVPADYWGSDILAVNMPRAYENDDPPYRRTYYQVLTSEDQTELSINGSQETTLFINSYWEVARSGWDEVSNHFTATDPIFIVQYMNGLCDEFPYSDSCDSSSIPVYSDEYGDASMTNLIHTDHFAREYIFESPQSSAIPRIFVNIVASTADVQQGRVVMDGRPVETSEFTIFPNTPEFAHASVRMLSSGLHTSSSMQGHALTIIGLGPFSAVSYPAGVRLDDPPLYDYENSLGMTFNLIPSGTFTMGSPESELGRQPDEIQHTVTLTKSFYMQTTEVTQAQWEAVMGSNPSYFSGCSDCPVESVTWNEVQDFITAMNALGEGAYRLPTEAEWEYAARAGSTTAFANGDITEIGCGYDPNLDAMGWYCYNASSQPNPVAQKQGNAWGLYDMHGNVWEWCQDWYGSYPTVPVTDPTGPTEGSYRVRRGGSWYDNAWFCRSALRWNSPPFGKSFDRGLRLSRTRHQTNVIQVGSGPRGIRITPDGDYAYAANFDNDTVSVINTSSNAVVETIAVGNGPWKIAITPNGSYAYVTNFYDDTVSVINTSSTSVVNTIAVGDGPSKIAITSNGNYAYVTNYYGDTVSVINISTNTVADTVSVGNTPYGIDITPNGDYAYVTSYNNYTVSVINTSTNSVVDTITVGNAPAGVAITPDGDYAYVSNLDDNTVSVIDTSTNGVVDTVSVGTDPAGVEITPDGKYTYVLNWHGNTVSVIDALSNSIVDTIPVGTYPWDIAITPDGNFAYITNNGDNTVSMIYLRSY